MNPNGLKQHVAAATDTLDYRYSLARYPIVLLVQAGQQGADEHIAEVVRSSLAELDYAGPESSFLERARPDIKTGLGDAVANKALMVRDEFEKLRGQLASLNAICATCRWIAEDVVARDDPEARMLREYRSRLLVERDRKLYEVADRLGYAGGAMKLAVSGLKASLSPPPAAT